MTEKKSAVMLIIMLIILAGLCQARPLVSLFLETSNARMNGATTVDVKDAARYRLAPLKPDMLQNSDGSPALDIGDQFILNLFADVTDTIIIDKIFNYLPGTYTIRGRVPGKEMTRLFITFTGEKLIALHNTPKQGCNYHIVYDETNKMCCIKEINPQAVNYLEGAPVLVPPDSSMKQIEKNELIKNDNVSLFGLPKTDANGENTTIDVMIVYTPAARAWAQSNENGINNNISQAMSLGQTALDNSDIAITLNLVRVEEVNYTESGSSSTDLHRLTFHSGYDPWESEGTPRYLEEVHNWRNTSFVDLTAIFTRCEDVGGVGWLLPLRGGWPELGFCLARVQQTSWFYTLVHEWGHNMGTHHRKDQAVQPGPGLYPYSAGWRWIGENGYRYCSVMSYTDSWNGNGVSRVGYFSNPDIMHQGAATGHVTDGDNARGLNEIRTVVAGYRIPGAQENPQISGTISTVDEYVSNVSLFFSNGGGTTTTDNNGQYSKTVPYNWSGTVTPSKTGYTFHPTFRSFAYVTVDQKYQSFYAYEQTDNFKVLVPNGGESWKHSEQRIITWTGISTDEQVYVDLYNNGAFYQRLKSGGTRNDGNFTWDISEAIPAGSKYKIRITGTTTSAYDESDNYFTIKELIVPVPPTLLAPANGETNVSTMTRLEWNVATNAMYRLQIANDNAFTTLLLEDPSLLTFHYNVPAWILPTNTTCYWRVQTILDGTNSEWSDIFQFQTAASIEPVKLFISNLMPANYQAVYLDEQEKYYTDRNYQIMSIPDSLKHLFWIRTANDDKNNASADMIRFQLLKGATIYIAYDSRATAPPDWLGNDFTLTNSVINVNDKFNYFTIWEKHLTTGPVQLGGNMAPGAADTKTNYVVLLKPDMIKPELVVSAPNGGETWYKGSTRVISWSCAGDVGDKVKIELYQAGSIASVICDTTANNNFYTWIIPGSLAAGNNYKIRITSAVNDTVWDESNAAFTIADEPKITVLVPNGGETWLKGSPQIIAWNSVGDVGGQVKTGLYKAGSLIGFIQEATANDDSLGWTVPDTLAAGNDYRMRITALADNAVWDESDAPFTIDDIPQLTLTSPNGGECWLKGSPQTITWNSLGNVGSNLKIDLYKNGSFDRLVNMNAANTGSCKWTVPVNVNNGKLYKIKITSIANKELWDDSDSLFTITDHPQLIVTSPNGGETWYKNSMQTITWQNTGIVGENIKIELFKNGVLTTTISETTANDDSLFWMIPPALVSGDDYKIRITSTSNDTVWDESDAQFGILERPSITLIEPTGGEILIKGTTHIIAWNKTGDTGSLVKIELFKSGIINSTIRAATANDDSLAWVVPFTLPSATDYTLKITSLANPDWFDSSDSAFTIHSPLPAAVSLLTPADVAIITTPTPLFSWTASEFATGYRLQVDVTTLFTSPALDVEIDSSHYMPAENLAAGNYYWRALAKNETGESNWSTVFGFILESSGILEYDSQAIPEHYYLAQNYPNPFNPITTIKCGMPRPGHVEVRVINLAGQLLDVLIARHLPPGTATLTWNAAPYPSGVYYYVMTADGFRDVKKMLLIK